MLRGCRMQAAGASVSPQPGINGLSRTPRLPAARSRRRCAAIARGSVDPPRAVETRRTKFPDELHLRNWKIDSWRQYEALQQPAYPDMKEYRRAVEEIRRMPPLVFAGECRTLQAKLAEAAAGEAFVLQGGDCAEAFADLNANRIRDTYRVLLQMSVVLTFGGGMPVVKMGRMAGQFAKPRSAPTETIDGVQLPSYRGDIINGARFDEKSRVPDPWRLLKAYNHCASTLNLLRGFSSGGYAALNRVTEWSLDFMRATDNGHAYIDLAERVKEAITFMVACGLDLNTPLMKETDFFTCHEALLLEYEEALTREDSTTCLAYDTSAHFLWCGERTRNLDGAHVEFLRGVSNPIGVKVSDKAQPSELVSLIATLNPLNTPGRIAIVTRMGADKLKKHLPAFISAVQNSGQVTTWICDPMHGNTESVNGFKTRRFENIQKEVETFFDVHETMGSIPGGIHLEMTGDNVTECVGGGAQISEDDLNSRYHTHCDPRLNAEQALELAFYAASRLRSRKNRRLSASSNGAVPLPSL